MGNIPPATLLPELEGLLLRRPPEISDAVRRVVKDVRPCVMLQSTRISEIPLRGRFLDRLRGIPPPDPQLPPTVSKFGGMPYAESQSDLQGGEFIGQINFSEVWRSLSAEGAPAPIGMPTSGLMAVDRVPGHFRARARWYPDPDDRKAVRPFRIETVAKYEAKIGFRGGWSLRGLEWFDAASNDEELWAYLNELDIPNVDVDGRGGHKLFGHPNEALNEHYGLEPVAGRSESIRDYGLIWRIDFDNAAGFSWGTNWFYVVLHKEDLKTGAFDRAIVTAANA